MTIYLDNAATTPTAPEVIKEMVETQEKFWANPSSLHTLGQEAACYLDEKRRFVASFLGVEPEEIIFTSGGSESDNLAIRGIVGSWQSAVGSITNSQSQTFNGKPHIVTSQVEHHAVLHTVEELEKAGKIEATYLKPDADGLIKPEQVTQALKDNTVLVSLIYVNNETGVVTPIAQIGRALEAENEKRVKSGKSKVYFHTDAVQAVEYLESRPNSLKVDLLSFTAHKLHGPKGIGVLFVKKGTPIKPEITGGGQEFRLRAGTENLAGVAGLAKALELIVKERESGDLTILRDFPELIASPENLRIKKLRDKLESDLLAKIPESYLNGSKARRSPAISNISFVNAEGESMLMNLDFLDIAVSTGSACSSKSLAPSHVLTAMGIPPEKAHGSIRFSLSRHTSNADIEKVIEVLPGIVARFREMSPFK